MAIPGLKNNLLLELGCKSLRPPSLFQLLALAVAAVAESRAAVQLLLVGVGVAFFTRFAARGTQGGTAASAYVAGLLLFNGLLGGLTDKAL